MPDVSYAGMMEYDGDARIPPHYLVEPPAIDRTLGQYLCATGVTSFATSDMVGHTGIVSSVLIAMAAVDICLARLIPEIEHVGG